MIPAFSEISWTDFANGLWLVVLAVITGIGAMFGYRKSHAPDAPPTVVQATLVDERLLERMVTSFEAMVRLLSSTAEVISRNTDIIHDNTEQLKINTKMLRDILEQSERLAKDVRELTFEIERGRK